MKQAIVTRWSKLTPLGRVGKSSDVAAAVLLLADDAASFISGQTLGVDGGLFSGASLAGGVEWANVE